MSRFATDDEQPIGGGVWHERCAHCQKTTTHSGFTDAHGCEVGSGCNECRWLTTVRGCEFTRARVMTIDEFVNSLRRRPRPERRTA